MWTHVSGDGEVDDVCDCDSVSEGSMEGVFTNLRRRKREKERKSTKTRRQRQKASTKLTVAPWFMYSLEELGPPQVRGPIAIPILREKPRESRSA